MFNQTVTVINHYVDKLTRNDKWNKTILQNCMWREQTAKTVANNQIQVDDCVSLTVPYRNGYLPPKQYVKVPNDEMKNYFTFNSDSNLDIIVLGEVTQEINDTYTITNVKKDYDNVATISAVSDNSIVDLLRHWKVTGK